MFAIYINELLITMRVYLTLPLPLDETQNMSEPQFLPINTKHVRQQFDRRAPLDAQQFLYGEIALRMLSRLDYIRYRPTRILDAGCGAGHAIDTLQAQYPEMQYTGLDHSPILLEVARQRHTTQPSLWQRLRKQPALPLQFVQADLAKSLLPPESQDFVWSNLALHWHPQPEAVFTEWRRLLVPEGLLMFSVFGPATLRELREAMAQAELPFTGMQFVDMHDYGDQLLQSGFEDPVMDQETITLTYQTAEKLLSEVHLLGGNPVIGRYPALSSRAQYQRLLNALNAQRHMDGTLHLSIEVAYGHAWRAKTHRHASGEVSIPISSITRRRKK